MITVPIVFSSSNYYVPYLATAIQSLISNSSPSRVYHIYVFNNSITECNIKRIKRMQTENIKISFMNIDELVKDEELYIPGEYVSKETYYRLFAVDLLKEYDKLVYLDCDLIVLRDIADLYDENIDDYILGAVWNYNDFGSIRHIENNLKIPPERCINAGVMVINTRRFIEMNIKNKCLKCLKDVPNPLWVDQELLNIVAWKETKIIDNKWNFQYHAISNETGEKPEMLAQCLKEVKEEQYIMHYSGVLKPWMAPEIEYAEYFWKYARKTEFYEEIIYRHSNQYGLKIDNAFEKYVFPFDKVRKGSKVILYGMGEVGKAFYAQNILTKYCNIVLCADKNYKKFRNSRISISSPKMLKNCFYDFVVIAIENDFVRNEVANELELLGVSKEKMIFENPLKDE